MLKAVCTIAFTPHIDSLGKVTWLLCFSLHIYSLQRPLTYQLVSLVDMFSELRGSYDKKNFNSLWLWPGAIRQTKIPPAEGDSVYVETQDVAHQAILGLG